MKAAVYYNNHHIPIEEYPIPQIGPEEILVKVMASGICGTDLMEWYRIKKAPCVLGHEICGEIVESKSKRFKISDRVFVSHHVPCNSCKYCIEGNHTACEKLHKGNFYPGGYSEFVRVPRENVALGTYLLPKEISYEEGVMIEPLACVLRAQRIIDIKESHTVLIFGCGVSGLLNIILAKQKGATVISTDLNNYRLKKAREFGADKIFNARGDFSCKADRIIICTCAIEAVSQAFRNIDRKGIILFFAIPDRNFDVPIPDFWRDEITITFSYGAAPVDLEEALALIKSKIIDVKPLITHRLPLEKIQEGFNIALEAKESLKVILTPHSK